MRRNSKRFVSCLLVMALALALMTGCGAKSDDIEVKSLGQELFPETTGLLDTLKMVQEGGGSIEEHKLNLVKGGTSDVDLWSKCSIKIEVANYSAS